MQEISQSHLGKSKCLSEYPAFEHSFQIHEAGQKNHDYCNSESLSQKEPISQNKKKDKNKLYVLILQSKLQELGFRRHQYQKYLAQYRTTQLTLQSIDQIVANITDRIIESSLQDQPVISSRPQFRMAQSPALQKNTNINKPKPNRQPLTVCSVCLADIYEITPIMKEFTCHHLFCDECIKNTVEQAFRDSRFDITCLQLHCGHVLGEKLAEKCLPKDKFQRYKYFKRKKLLESDPTNKFCTKPNCQGILEEKTNIRVCPICKTQYCLNCLRLDHTGDCQSQLEQVIEKVYDHLKIKKCPKCKSPIEKSQGCNHMTCKKCNFQFCWICLRSYSKFHYRYFNCFGCPGMQFGEEQDVYRERFKQLIFYLLLPVMLVFALSIIISGLPIYMVVISFMKTNQKALEWNQCQNCIGYMIMFLLMLPFGLLYGMLYGPFKYFTLVYLEISGIYS